MARPSQLSVVTDMYPESTISNSSSTTVTQQTHNDESEDESQSEPETYISDASQAVPKQVTATAMQSGGQPNVFQYMQPVPTVEEYSDEEQRYSPGSPVHSASSDDESEHEGTQSSRTDSSQFVKDTPATSPVSTRMSEPDAAQRRARKLAKAKTPLYASSFVHGYGGHDQDEEAEESGEASEDDSDEAEDDHEAPHHHDDPGHAQHFALQRTSPPRASSTCSGHSDARAKRLKQQEQDLAKHILQSPQPKKEFQFAGGPSSPHAHPSMPLYSPHAYPGEAPAHFEPTTGHAAEWAQFPAPLPIGYPTQSQLASPTASHVLPLSVQSPRQPPPQYQAHVPACDMTRPTAAGYELVANKLSERPKKSSKSVRKGGKIVPMYRKFEHLNHRVLLHLQDEVSELEEELRYLDESIVQMSPRDEAGQALPASRRGEARYGSELHFKRTELLGRIFQKLGQYNQALTSFHSLVQELEAASAEDIQAYRAWMEKRSPIDSAERRFLERKGDLVAVSRRRVSARHGEQYPCATVAWLPLVLVLPLLAFAIVPSLLGRVVVIGVIGGAELRQVTLTPELMKYMSIQGWWIGGLM
ncbi:hypothetical protein ACEQ8H_008675 [Pleosporales sp. CAS-2024a]